MSSFRNRRSLVPISLVMAVTMLVAAGPGSALADTSHGNIGAYSVHDTPTDPGLLCTYNADMEQERAFEGPRFSRRGPSSYLRWTKMSTASLTALSVFDVTVIRN